MNAITLLTRTSPPVLTPAEDAFLTRELSAAYHLDEAAATSPEVQRISEKIRLRLLETTYSSEPPGLPKW
jgi:hypothetical protein